MVASAGVRLPVEVVVLACDRRGHVNTQDTSIVASGELPVGKWMVLGRHTDASLLLHDVGCKQRVGGRDERLKHGSRARLGKGRAQTVVARTRGESVQGSVVGHLASLVAALRRRCMVAVRLAKRACLVMLSIRPLAASASLRLDDLQQPRVGRARGRCWVAGVVHHDLDTGVDVESGHSGGGCRCVDMTQVAGSSGG